MNWTAFNSLIILLLIITACESDHRQETIDANMEINGYVLDRSIDAQLDSVITAVNCVIRESGLLFTTTDSIVLKNKKHLVVVPFLSPSGNSSTGFSLVDDKLIFISPSKIKAFVQANSLSDPNDIRGYLAIVLLHEWAHIYMNLPSSIDPPKPTSELGEQSMEELNPQILTKSKKDELKVDSLAVAWTKQAITSTRPGCFDTAMNIQLALNGAEFIIFGLRKIESFGSPQQNHLIDPSNSHPNFELRLAFMNYYFNPTEAKREMIDQYLYDRVEGSLMRQQTDPRINQSMEKK